MPKTAVDHAKVLVPGWAKHAWSCFLAPFNAEPTVLAGRREPVVGGASIGAAFVSQALLGLISGTDAKGRLELLASRVSHHGPERLGSAMAAARGRVQTDAP